jgi:hypothetical protein
MSGSAVILLVALAALGLALWAAYVASEGRPPPRRAPFVPSQVPPPVSPRFRPAARTHADTVSRFTSADAQTASRPLEGPHSALNGRLRGEVRTQPGAVCTVCGFRVEECDGHD